MDTVQSSTENNLEEAGESGGNQGDIDVVSDSFSDISSEMDLPWKSMNRLV